MIGVPNTTIMNFVNRNGAVQSDTKQGLSPEMVTEMVQYYSNKGKPKAIEFLGVLAKAGAKAWIYL